MNTDFLLELICKARIAPAPGYTSPFSSGPLSLSSRCSSRTLCITLLILVTNKPVPPPAPLRAGCPCHTRLRTRGQPCHGKGPVSSSPGGESTTSGAG